MESRDLFTGIFVKYENVEDIFNSATHFKEVRTRFGGVVKDNLIFDKDHSATMPMTKPEGYVAFVADLEFQNVEFLPIATFGGAL
jgi:hypothetical protein